MFYTYINPVIWENQIPHRYILVINLLVLLALYWVISRREKLLEQVYYKATIFTDFYYYLFWIAVISVFGYGSYLVYNVLYAQLMGYAVVSTFEDVNLYVTSSLNTYSLVNNLFLDPFISAVLYQGFLLGWLTHKSRFTPASVLTALVYGYFSRDIIGATLYCLILNLVFIRSNNILYPALLHSLNGLAYIILYSISRLNNSGVFILNAHLFADEAGSELRKGAVIMALLSPIVIYVVLKMIKEMVVIDKNLERLNNL